MRPRSVTLCSALSAVALAAAPGLAAAAPHHNHGLTVNATPRSIDAGEAVLIYGRLMGTGVSGKTIVLYHHIAGSHRGYSVIGTTTTSSSGYYDFTREENVVETNRSWFTRLAGEPGTHSRTVYERVSALVNLSVSSPTADTSHAVTFTGLVTPEHRFQRVLLQAQTSSGDDWRTIKTGLTGGASRFAIGYRWATPGIRNIRVVFPGDRRNVRGDSDAVAVVVQQAQVAGFTIGSSAPRISYGTSTMITGVLDQPGTTTPEASTAVELCYGAGASSTGNCVEAGMTDTSGNYSFTVAPVRNAWYRVKTVLTPRRHTAPLFLGVNDVITLSAASTGVVGQSDTFSGSVTPDKTGHPVYLQRLGHDGDFHTVAVTRVLGDGSYSIKYGFGTPGSKTFRTRILGGDANLGNVSPRVTVAVALPPLASLPAAS